MRKTAFIAIVGKPNVGKSTLLNTILGEKVAIVSDKPQTTRNRITGILTRGDTQYVFLDTPGVHKPKNRLGDYMVKTATEAISDVDCVLYVVEADAHISPSEEKIMNLLSRGRVPAILLINKIDQSNGEKVGAAIEMFSQKHAFQAVIPISAAKNRGIDIIFEELEPFLRESDWFFPEDIATDQPERQIAAEVIREKILRLTSEEIPHGTAVVIEDFSERKDLVSIRAEIYCERESHKGILIGKNGATLKRIGTYAREDLEKLFHVQVYLNLWVKVKENWRENAVQVANFGFRDD
ncbi:MAG: GTPase Era [Candidatus Methanomethylophilaceae archaeon]|nr:GTPase Era [Candidatus Methanomethylophilaceae archaeon]